MLTQLLNSITSRDKQMLSDSLQDTRKEKMKSYQMILTYILVQVIDLYILTTKRQKILSFAPSIYKIKWSACLGKLVLRSLNIITNFSAFLRQSVLIYILYASHAGIVISEKGHCLKLYWIRGHLIKVSGPQKQKMEIRSLCLLLLTRSLALFGMKGKSSNPIK